MGYNPKIAIVGRQLSESLERASEGTAESTHD